MAVRISQQLLYTTGGLQLKTFTLPARIRADQAMGERMARMANCTAQLSAFKWCIVLKGYGQRGG